MRPKDLLTKIVGIAAPPPFLAESERRRASTLYFLLLLLLASFSLLIIIPIRQEIRQVTYALYIADDIVLICLILARLGQISFSSYLVSFGLALVNTYILYYRQGANDISILGLPVIIALGGLLLGRRGSLVLTGMCIFCYGGVIWAEMQGLTLHASFQSTYQAIADLIIASILLVTTSVLIFFIKGNLTASLKALQFNDQALQTAHASLQHYTTIMEQRSEQLLTGAKVSRAASTILEPNQLCQTVVDMVCERFGLYYVGLFQVDEQMEWANLFAATGKAGKALLKKGHRQKVGGPSMIGWCIANQKAGIAFKAGDQAPSFDNTLLPETRSELALPLISRGHVIGALGIHSNQESAFGEEDVTVFQAMADQLANAMSNARLYHQLQRELAERKRVEMEIRRLNSELEERVAERTRELQVANEDLTTLSRLKDEFLANVSHELRTPLTSIMLYHNMLEKQPQNLNGHVLHLKRETDRLAHLIEDLLYLTRLDQGYTPFNPIQLNLNQLAREYVADRSALAEERQLTIELETHDQLPYALADEQMTGQVLSAILTNALNYTPPGGCITISTRVEESQGRLWTGFAVSDTGPGISMEDQARLFERFYRGLTGRASSTPGTGLGLSIAREIVYRHGGKIVVQSPGIPGKGATFIVWLPVAA